MSEIFLQYHIKFKNCDIFVLIQIELIPIYGSFLLSVYIICKGWYFLEYFITIKQEGTISFTETCGS